jgi:hypothetical protein
MRASSECTDAISSGLQSETSQFVTCQVSLGGFTMEVATWLGIIDVIVALV